MTNPPLPEEIREQIDKEAKEWASKGAYELYIDNKRSPSVYGRTIQDFTVGAESMASLALALKDALERIAKELESKNKAMSSIIADIPRQLKEAIAKGDEFEVKELKVLSTVWGSAYKERESHIKIAREALSKFPEQGKEEKDG